jgi:hypothetical protein
MEWGKHSPIFVVVNFLQKFEGKILTFGLILVFKN